MEMLKLNIAGISKLVVVGVVICIGGVLTLALFKGPHFNLVCFHHLFGSFEAHHTQGPSSSGKTWIKGCFIMLTSNTCWVMWLVLQYHGSWSSQKRFDSLIIKEKEAITKTLPAIPDVLLQTKKT